MADRKISDLTALTTPASGDYLPIVDISEVAAASKNKRITIEELMRGAPNGTAAAPSIAFESDPNTGIYSPGADQLAISTNGTERMRLDSSGRLGLGTSSPSAQFQTVGSVSAPSLTFNNSAVSTFGAGSVQAALGVSDSSPFPVYLQARDTINGSRNLLLNPLGGNVGIGTTSPATTLDVNGDVTISDKIIHGGDTNTAIRFPAADTIALETNGSERARIDNSGRLLVGTSSAVGVGSSSISLFLLRTSGTAAAFVADRTDTAGAVLSLGKSRSAAIGGVTLIESGDTLGDIRFVGADGVDLESYAASISAAVDGTPGADDMPGRLVFATTADGAASPTERLRITSAGVLQVADAGNITVGTTTGTKIGTGTTQKLGFYNATPVVQPAAVANITTTATAGALPTPDGAVTIADTATPTVTELLEYCVELEAKLEDLLGKLRTVGIIAT